MTDVKPVLMDHLDANDAKADIEHLDDAPANALSAGPGSGPAGADSPEPVWLRGTRLWLALFGLMMAQFVTSMGGQMISPAFNIIIASFDGAAASFGWVGSAFFMAQCPCMLLFGQLLSAFDGKKLLFISVAIFALGSIICGSAKTINAVIVGRAIDGIAASGIWVGVLSLIAAVSPLEERPKIMGIFGLINAVGSAAGPPLAGYFADSVTWRLCFYFTIPLSAIALAAIWLLVPKQEIMRPFGPGATAIIDPRYRFFARSETEPNRNSVLYRLLGVDWLGFVLITTAVICLQLAIQWGGSSYAWTSGHIIGLVVGGFFGISVLFVAWEWRAGESALLPLFLFRQRTQWGGCLLSLVTLYANLIGVIILPYFFEVCFGSSALKAGYQIMPYLLGAIMFSLISGLVTTAIGHFFQWLIVGPIFLIVSGALYYTIQSTATSGQLYGYQILFAAGVGFTQQQVYIAIQATSKQEDIHLRIAAVSFTELFGGALCPTISTTILSNKLSENLARYAPDAPATVARSTAVIATLSEELQAQVRKAYVYAMHSVFIQLCAMGALALLFSITLVKPVNLKKIADRHVAAH